MCDVAMALQHVELTFLQLVTISFRDPVELGHLRRHLELDELPRVSVVAVPGAGSRHHLARARACSRPDWCVAKVGKLGLLEWSGDLNLVEIGYNTLILAMQSEEGLDIFLQV